MMFNLVLFFMLCGIYFMQFKEKFSLTGVCQRMNRLEACVASEELTPAIVAKQDQKAIEAQKPKWKSGPVIEKFPNYDLIKTQLGNDAYAESALRFASSTHRTHGLLFTGAKSSGRLYVENLKFESFGDYIQCDGFVIFKNGKITRAFKKFIS